MEWKELKIDNLPSDILTGDYEVEIDNRAGWLKQTIPMPRLSMLENVLHYGSKYRYRKPEPLPPTHSEIMTKWWKDEDDAWKKPIWYKNGRYAFHTGLSHLDEWFTNRESAKIPPEAL